MKFTLPVLTITASATVTITYAVHYDNFNNLLLVIQGCHLALLLWGPLKLTSFNSFKWAVASPTLRSGTSERWPQSSSQCWWPCPSHHLTSYRMCEGSVFWASHGGGSGFTQHSLSNITISLSLKIPSSTLSQGLSGISNSFQLGHLWTSASKHSNKLLTPF